MLSDQQKKVQTKVLTIIQDLVSNLMYYDRKEDEEAPRGYIESAIEMGAVTVDKMVDEFRDTLEEWLEG